MEVLRHVADALTWAQIDTLGEFVCEVRDAAEERGRANFCRGHGEGSRGERGHGMSRLQDTSPSGGRASTMTDLAPVLTTAERADLEQRETQIVRGAAQVADARGDP